VRSLATVFTLAASAFLLYSWQVSTTPPSLAEDEVIIAMSAHSIATTGRDLFGRSWPLYFQMTEGSWFHPVIVYSIALVLQVLSLSEIAIRLPTVCAGVGNVVLMYFTAKALFRREAAAVLAAILLALTPTHFLHSRFALEYLYPLPFILTWLLCLFTYLQGGDRRWVFASTIALGIGFYSYIGSVIVMPMYMVLTVIVLLLRGTPPTTIGLATLGFLLPLFALFVPWLVQHQGAFGNTVGHYLIYDTRELDPLQGLRELLSHSSLVARTTTYWGYLNPSFLFLDLTAPFMYSTRTTGVFLLPLLLFVPVGLYQALRSGDPARLLLVIGFLTAPVAAVIVGEQGAIGRALELLPFGVLLAVVGIVHLWTGPSVRLRRLACLAAGGAGVAVGLGYAVWTLLSDGRISASTPLLLFLSVGAGVAGMVSDRAAWRGMVIAALAASCLQFQYYLKDYFGDYPARASEAFVFNRRGALEALIERSAADGVPRIYINNLDRDVDMIARYWRFYLIKHQREDLWPRTTVLGESDSLEITSVPAKSAILARTNDPSMTALVASGEVTLETLIPEPGGRALYAVFRR
jgi:4-amino-4-deoxy-L-arabinose transferase-like glycosyltransferase